MNKEDSSKIVNIIKDYTFDYDDVLNKQRNIVYYERRRILESLSVQKSIFAYGEQIITELLLELNEETLTKIGNLFGRNLILNYSVLKYLHNNVGKLYSR